jgi:hypothetical protein
MDPNQSLRIPKRLWLDKVTHCEKKSAAHKYAASGLRGMYLGQFDGSGMDDLKYACGKDFGEKRLAAAIDILCEHGACIVDERPSPTIVVVPSAMISGLAGVIAVKSDSMTPVFLASVLGRMRCCEEPSFVYFHTTEFQAKASRALHLWMKRHICEGEAVGTPDE